MTPEQYRANQQATASNSQAKVLTLFGLSALVGGLVSAAEFKMLAATVIAAANIQAAMLADVFMAGRLGTQPLGLSRPDDEANRIAEAIQTIIEDTDTKALGKIKETDKPLARIIEDTDTATPLPRISRLAHAEPLAIAQSASREVLIAHEVEEYYWDTDSDPCNLCAFLASQNWPTKAKEAVSHPNCLCLVLPVSSSQ